MTDIILYDYWRSSASYRVRIALNMKGLAYQSVERSLLNGDQKSPEYVARNPQGFVPMLTINGRDITQSLAIIDYLDHIVAEPRLIPTDADARADCLARAMVVMADIHPVNNLRMLKYLKNELGQDQEAVNKWYRHWIEEGFAALEEMAGESEFLGGDAPDLSDIALVPQIYNARRFEVDMAQFPKLTRIDADCLALPAFANATPEAVKPE